MALINFVSVTHFGHSQKERIDINVSASKVVWWEGIHDFAFA